MIRVIQENEIDRLKPLMESFYLEQKTYLEVFNWDYIKTNLLFIIDDYNSVILVDDDFTCFFIGHVAPNLLLPIMEGCEDYMYILPQYRGTLRFPRLVDTFEKWCRKRNAKYNDLGTGTGIETDKIREVYKRKGYTEYRFGFKKELR